MDKIRHEILKTLDIVGLSWVTHLSSVVSRSGTMPVEWQEPPVPWFPFSRRWTIACDPIVGRSHYFSLVLRILPLGLNQEIEIVSCPAVMCL